MENQWFPVRTRFPRLWWVFHIELLVYTRVTRKTTTMGSPNMWMLFYFPNIGISKQQQWDFQKQQTMDFPNIFDQWWMFDQRKNRIPPSQLSRIRLGIAATTRFFGRLSQSKASGKLQLKCGHLFTGHDSGTD